MVYFTEKRISGKKYLYAVHSVRLPNGKVSKLAKRVEERKITASLEAHFQKKEAELRAKSAEDYFKKTSVFSGRQIRGIEETKLAYKKIVSCLTKKQLQDLFDRFTVNFTYESNALEGNSLTLKDVAILISENRVPENKDLREVYETKNSRKVVDLIMKKKFRATEKDIIKMHKILIKDMDIRPGYKKVPNFLLGRNIETTPPEKVEKEMKELFKWHKENKQMHPLRLAALFHGKFEKIHPFEDGNGRVGRFMINTILVNNGYAPLIIRKSQRIAYLKSLGDFDNGYSENLERFLLDKYKTTFAKFFKIYEKYV
ncbi:MAG: Fic family protein [archaeon]|nr:Fic family protein [archaeon]